MVSMQIVALVAALSSTGETVLLDFYAPWCAPCRSMDATVAELQQAGYPVRKVNTDHDRALAAKHNVQSIPCFVLLVDGKEVGRATGAVRRAELLALFSQAKVPAGDSGAIARAQSPDPLSVPGEIERDPFRNSVPVDRPRDSRADFESPVAATPPASMQDLIHASVRLTIQDPQGYSYGSGTLIDAQHGNVLVLTCGHIFRDAQGRGQITVDLFGPHAPQKVPGRLVAYDLKSDIGLVMIQPGVPVSVARVAPQGQPLRKGDTVYNVGCNNGGPATALESKITAIDKFIGSPNIQVAGLPVQGRSGGGLFTSAGLVIGVCNAADPADNEGLYAALTAIHGQLDKAGMSAVYRARPVQPESSFASSGTVPNMPRRMPESGFAPRGNAAAPLTSSAEGAMNDSERAALAEMRRRGDSAEVICIVRSLSDPRAKSEVIMLDRASSAFLKQLAADREVQEARHLTSLEVRRPPADRLPAMNPRQTSGNPSPERTWR